MAITASSSWLKLSTSSQEERERGRTDLTRSVMVRAIFAAHKTLLILVENGY